MIMVRLSGGIGNQMFQYATGRTVALLQDTEVVFDTVEFDYAWMKPWNTRRKYELGCFSLPARFASNADIMKFMRFGCQRLTPFRRWANHYYREAEFRFDPAVMTQGQLLYLEGYWQSPRYFERYFDVISQDFAWKSPLSSPAAEIAAQISAAESVGIHVRRGDYVSNPKTQAHHGSCSIDYYRKAVAYITDRLQTPRLFVFSDDPDWVESSLQFELPTVVFRNNQQAPPAEDMRLMSLCKHNVIANSSFSWWAAWLNVNPAKLVVAPQKWFADSAINTADLIPGNWVRL